jgi:hypothetical protein
MTIIMNIHWVGLSLLATWPAIAAAAGVDAPRVFQCSGAALAAARERAVDGDPAMTPILKALRDRADALLNDEPFSIVKNAHPLPAVDPHDYVSLAPYYWPNPDTPNGLPYIRRDGERNPEAREYDARTFSAFSDHVWNLALAGYMTGDERYSRRAALLLRTWFIDRPTRMNPNLDHGQFVKGENVGRGTGIIESNRFLPVLDGVGLLQKSDSWSADDQSKLQDWFRAYLKWLHESPNGLAESRATNNHSTWYDVQDTTYLLFVGDEAAARKVVEAAKTKRIAAQIEPDGRMPRELTRTKSWGYSCFNVKALTTLADLGQRLDVDLWTYRSADGRSIRAALDFLLPFATGQQKWPHQQISRFDSKELLLPLRRAAIALKDRKYVEAMTQLQGSPDGDRLNVLGFQTPEQTKP